MFFAVSNEKLSHKFFGQILALLDQRSWHRMHCFVNKRPLSEQSISNARVVRSNESALHCHHFIPIFNIPQTFVQIS